MGRILARTGGGFLGAAVVNKMKADIKKVDIHFI
jgi:hypothetical protein